MKGKGVEGKEAGTRRDERRRKVRERNIGKEGGR